MVTLGVTRRNWGAYTEAPGSKLTHGYPYPLSPSTGNPPVSTRARTQPMGTVPIGQCSSKGSVDTPTEQSGTLAGQSGRGPSKRLQFDKVLRPFAPLFATLKVVLRAWTLGRSINSRRVIEGNRKVLPPHRSPVQLPSGSSPGSAFAPIRLPLTVGVIGPGACVHRSPIHW